MSTNESRVCYAEQVWYGTVTVEQNLAVARDTFRIRVACPPIASRIVPGQFVMMRLARSDDPLLGRPLAMYDVVEDVRGDPWALDVVYVAVGKMTRRLAALGPGDRLELWGPLGNGFPPAPTGHLVMVAGGIGQTPFLALAQESLGRRCYGRPPRQAPRAGKVSLCYGAQSGDRLACVEDFSRAGVEVHLATEDGSVGHRGMVTELIEPVIGAGPADCRVVCCGPEAMMAATAKIATRLHVPCQVSLETPMACGIGVCFSCVARIRDASGGWDYRRTCVEGPVFDAADVEFSS